MRAARRASFVAVLLFLLSVSGRAAGVPVLGVVLDPALQPLPGAAVELVSAGRVVAQTVVSADGTFRFTDVAPGRYEVHVRLAGFRETIARITVGTDAPPPLRIKLLVGSPSEKVEVTGATPVVNTPPRGVPAPPPSMEAPATARLRSGDPSSTPTPPTARPLGVAGGGGQGGGDYRMPPQCCGATPQPSVGSETYAPVDENGYRRPADHPLSTFSIDVDTASYAKVRRFLNEGRLPPADAVRVEELINYFHFEYADSTQGAPFGVTTELTQCPWNASHKLALIGLQARQLPERGTPPRNLVFLLDVSGSMATDDKLPLVKNAMKMLAETLTSQDRVAIVTYAGTTGIALPSTRGDRTDRIQDAISSLSAGGSTNGGAGIQLAYQLAADNFVSGGINRVILATDGDFNVGLTSVNELSQLIEQKRDTGVFLSVLGVGTGNLKDATMEKLADKGNGNYAYLDSLTEARRVLIAEAGATLVTVAKDVKIQVEFNPALVGAYRLVGYENRRLRARDFNDDTKDAGEMGAGHTVTALYEIVPPGEPIESVGVDPLKYQRPATPERTTVASSELMTVKVRYKQPDGDRSSLVTVAVAGRNTVTPRHIAFAAAVAEFGMLLRESPFKADATWLDVVRRASANRGSDPDGYRAEFIRLVALAASLDRQRSTSTSMSRR